MNDVVPMSQAKAGEIMEAVIARGDLSQLNASERAKYYTRVCESLGLNPLTKPFEYITLNNKLTLYARRDCADQLRKVNGISIEVVERSVNDGLLTVHVRAVDKTGRRDEDFGVVNIAGLKGEAAANAMLKCVTKAKRRVTLSISGLGWLDETEVADIPGVVHEAWGEEQGRRLGNALRTKPEPAPAASPSPHPAVVEAPQPVTPHVTAGELPPNLTPVEMPDMPQFLRRSAASLKALQDSGVLEIVKGAEGYPAKMQSFLIALHNNGKACKDFTDLSELQTNAAPHVKGNTTYQFAASAIIEHHKERIEALLSQ